MPRRSSRSLARRPLRGAAGEKPFERVAHLLDLERLAGRDQPNPGSSVGLADDESLLVQRGEGGADGRAAGAEANREIRLDEAFVGLELTADDRVTQPVAGVVDQPRARGAFGPEEGAGLFTTLSLVLSTIFASRASGAWRHLMLASHHRVGKGVGVLFATLSVALAACGSTHLRSERRPARRRCSSASSRPSPEPTPRLDPRTSPHACRGTSHQQRRRGHGAHGELPGV